MDEDKLQEAAKNLGAKQGIKEMAAGGRQKNKRQGDRQVDEDAIDLEEAKETIRSAFLGYHYETMWNPEKKKNEKYKVWRVENPENFDPICNEKALEDFFIEIDSVANVVISGGNLTPEQIERGSLNVMRSIRGLIERNRDEYDIDSQEDADAICSALLVLLMSVMSMAKKGWKTEQKHRSLSEKVMRVVGGDDQEKKKSRGGLF